VRRSFDAFFRRVKAGETPGYPKLDKVPPFHPQCDHFLMIDKAAFAARLAADAA